ncbi:hypothetical protein [Desulfovibrio sp. SGI.169]|uniref:hypothetical protein n=1 Tax=Desulfovibrio sp. SGI.169 TaxID=3420561 RepID=UPI003D0574FC
MLKRKVILACAALAFLICGLRSDIPAAERAGEWGRRDAAPAGKRKALHGPAWAFGQSGDRDAALWRDGMPVQRLHERAVGGKKAMNTASGIDNALNAANENEKKPRGGLGISVENETSTWRERLPAEGARPDESLPLESRHVVRAFADVEAGDALSISVGPELIIRDEQNREHSASNSQPDSALGLGMQFKLDF